MRNYFAVAILLLNMLSPALVWAESSTPAPRLLISELATGTSNRIDQEYIELYNPSDEPVILNGTEDDSGWNWRLEYKAAGGTTWSSKAQLQGSVEPRGYFLLATEEWFIELDNQKVIAPGSDYWTVEHEEVDQFFGFALPEAGGHLRVIAPNGQEVDRLGWGSAIDPEAGTAADEFTTCVDEDNHILPAALKPMNVNNESLMRWFGADGSITDTQCNYKDFFLSSSALPPGPRSSRPFEIPEVDEPTENDEVEPPPLPTPITTLPVAYKSVVLTEILPDPAAPQTDSEHEFIELHNPYNTPLNLKDYVIKSGSNLQYSFVLPNLTLQPGQYHAFYSRDGNLTLSNSGGRVQVINPNGAVASELVKYEKSKAGESWARIGSSWQWSNKPSPHQENRPSISISTTGNQASIKRAKAAVTQRQNYSPLLITELLPDPAAPLKDSDDEFIEIYNPNGFAVDLEGYVLRTGSTLKTKYKLPATTIKPGQYLAFFSSDANISLSNSGGKAVLEGENGTKVHEAADYPKAIPGASWVWAGGKWQWSTVASPAAANTVLEPAVKGATTRSDSGPTTAATSSALQAITSPASIPASPLSATIVSTAAAASLLYALYEFRYDIRNRWHLIRKALNRSK